MTSYIRSIATIGLSRTVSEIDGDFRRNRKIFPPPCIFAPLLNGFPWNWVSAHAVKN